MKFKYLGTAAGEGIPAVLCDCDVCHKSRLLGGRNLRARSQAMIDDVLLIDMPPETYTNLHRYRINLLDVRYWLVTHTHPDHFHTTEFQFTRNGNFAHYASDWHGIDIYGSSDLEQPLNAVICEAEHKAYLRYHRQTAFECFSCGEYRITPLKANHSTDNPFIYVVEKDGKSVLYAHDTGLFLPETMQHLKDMQVKLNLVSLDCTAGSRMDYDYPMHLCLGWAIQCRDELLKYNVADKHTVFVLNHFSHNGTDAMYEDFKPIAERFGFLTSYDGMELEV